MSVVQPAALGRIARRVMLAVLGAVFTVSGCGSSCCAPDPVHGEPEVCSLDTTCPNGDAFRFGVCQASGCLDDGDCCPGTRCRVDINACAPVLLDSEYACASDADCTDPAQRCLPTAIGERDPIPTCVYEACTTSADCGVGRACFLDHCVARAPCGGACPASTACDVVSGACTQVPDNGARCDAECSAGEIRVLKDPDTMSGERCCSIGCECVPLPPLALSRYGHFTRIAVGADGPLVSAYDAEYGDLVLLRYGLDGGLRSLEVLDGVPGGGAVVADPLGPRGGIAAPGDDVGTYNSIALTTDGLARIAYHDETNATLRIAVQTASGFRSHVVDPGDSTANVGQFTDIAIADNGTIFISYLAHDAALTGLAGRGTGVKVARSRTATPASPTDWDLITVDARLLADACNGSCGAGAECVIAGGAGVCAPRATDACAPACAGTDACVTLDGAPTCAAPGLPPDYKDVPRGRGLFSSIVLDGTDAWVAYYDAVDGDLRAARVVGNAVPVPHVVDGDGLAGHRGGDVGRFPSIAKVGANLFIAYEDTARHAVRAWTGTAPGENGSTTTVETGAPIVTVGEQAIAGMRFIGGGTRVAQQQSQPVLVYQDASNLDLVLQTIDGDVASKTTLLKAGAHGFASDVAVRNGNAFVVSVLAQVDARGVEASRVQLIIQPLP